MALLGGLLTWQPAILLRAGLWLAGHDEVRFDRLSVGLHRVELTGLTIGGPSAHRIGRLTIDYRPVDLVRGVARLSVEGLTLRGRVDRDGLRLEGLDLAAAGPDEGAGLPALPLPERVSVRDARLELTTPAGILVVPVEAQVQPQPDRARFVLDAAGAELTAATGRLRADLHVEGEMPLFAPSLRDVMKASGRAQLRAEALTVPGVATGIDGAGRLSFSWQGGKLAATLSDVAAKVAAISPEWRAVADLLPAPWQIELVEPADV
jgi:hypothetical protein